jgi:hypothetical protein
MHQPNTISLSYRTLLQTFAISSVGVRKGHDEQLAQARQANPTPSLTAAFHYLAYVPGSYLLSVAASD